MSSVFKTADGARAFRGGFDSHALSPRPAFARHAVLIALSPPERAYARPVLVSRYRFVS